jgi:alpha-galactosidase
MPEEETMKSQIRIARVAPWDQGEVAIHGPSVFGASVNKPFLYTVPATGERPLRFSAEGLPEGLQLDPANGQITGAARHEEDSEILLRAENRHGKAEKEFTIAIGRGLALTPPMGWNSWNAWRRWVDDGKIRSAAQELVKTGLAARGYSYVNIDSCWQGERGGKHGAIQPNSKFPDMESLAAHIHSLGLRFGIYSSPWTVPWGCTPEQAEEEWNGPRLIGCSSGDPDPAYQPHSIPEGHYVGIDKHEAQDMAQWAQWAVDFLKYDWSPTDPNSLERMGRLAREAPRDIVVSICTNARLADADAIKAWANMWRGLPDTHDEWSSVLKNAFLLEDSQREDWRPHVKPGSWNDLDMLALGPQFETPTKCHPNGLSPDEQITSMTAWALYPSPLILSCDLSALTDFELRLFANEEVIAVNQDPLGKPAVRFCERREQSLQAAQPQHNARIWARPLAGGTVAIGFFNLAESPDMLSVALKDLGLSRSASARNLWERRDIGQVQDRLSVEVPAHGAQLILVRQ